MIRYLKQTGVALITVMLILAIATIIAVSMSTHQQLDVHRSANILNYEQAYQYLGGAEAWAKQLLRRDRNANETDSFKDDWAKVLPPMKIEGGQITGKIEDLQARFNLNNLVQGGKPSKVDIEHFKQLLRVLNLPEEIAGYVVDWIDADEEPEFPGAEDNAYLGMTPAYRAANQMMEDVSELLLLKDVDYKMYEQLRPYVCALPAYTPVNLNTASAEVLSGMLPGISLEDAKTLVEDRGEAGHDSVDNFFEHPLLQGKTFSKDGFSVASNYFRLTAVSNIANVTINFMSTLERDSTGAVRLIERNRGQL